MAPVLAEYLERLSRKSGSTWICHHAALICLAEGFNLALRIGRLPDSEIDGPAPGNAEAQASTRRHPIVALPRKA